MMKIKLPTQVFAGRIATLPVSGRTSAIAKQAVSGVLTIEKDGLLGDEQADRKVHGGPDKAIHLYPPAHYATLAKGFPEIASKFVPGSLGENLSPSGFDEGLFHLGDVLAFGAARLQICQPRTPCWKIDEHFGLDGIAAFIADHSLAGWYLRVLSPGTATSDSPLELIERPAASPSLRTVLSLCQAHRPDMEQLSALAANSCIPEGWQRKLVGRLEWLRNNLAQPTAGFHVKPETQQ